MARSSAAPPKSRFPKLESSASLSYRQNYSPGINDTGGDTLTGDIRLAWDARPRTNIALSASRNMSLNASDVSATTTNVAATVTESIGLATTAIGTVSYNWIDYRGINRKDQMLQVHLSINRPFNKYWSAGLSYQYQHNNDDSSGFQPGRYFGRDYDRHVVTLSITNIF
ncbi:outer membrane beta-barrel protein [Termitidicoccus mucosus]|uniref:outer membrane beta-barrel protein n=1 Tax=Termitidicoccus mucosus TaxID=1184151 RepID=UPI00318340AF